MPESYKPKFPISGKRNKRRNNNKSRGKRQSANKNKSGKTETKSTWNSTKPSGNVIPQELSEHVILFDNDEFYGVYLDLLMFDFNKSDVTQVQTLGDFELFKKAVTGGKYKSNTYIVDELFGWGEVDIPKLVKNIRLLDAEAEVLGATALEDGAIANLDIYDNVVVKSKGTHEKSIIKQLAKKYNVTIDVNKDDPEFTEGLI